jgi:hypothetical protein
MKRKRSVQRLAERLEREHELLVDVSSFERVHAGHWQRSSGAWSWCAYLHAPENQARTMIGSQYNVKQLLAAPALTLTHSICQIEIDPS